MIGPAFLILGAALAVIGWLLLRRAGTGWRIGRLLSAAPQVGLEEANLMAGRGEERYVRIHGRIDSDEEFPGDDGKPIVFRRRRLQRQTGRSTWSTFDDERLAVPFGLVERGVRVDIDTDALGDGLVVVPRLSVGVAADLTEAAASTTLPDLPPDATVRLRIDHVSAVEHATAAGVPRPSMDEGVAIGPGLGRPLIFTTLDPDEAMRVLAADHRSSLLVAAGLMVAGPVVVVLGLLLTVIGT